MMVFILAIVFFILGILCIPPLLQAWECRNYLNISLALIVMVADWVIAIGTLVIGIMQELGV